VRRIARDLFPDDAPGQGREWHLTDAQAAQICEHLAGDEPGEFYDYDAAVVAMLTLRINTPVGEWLNDADHKRFWANAADVREHGAVRHRASCRVDRQDLAGVAPADRRRNAATPR